MKFTFSTPTGRRRKDSGETERGVRELDTEAFLNVFGKLTVANVVQIILAVAFLIYVGKKIRDYLIKRYEAEQRKDEQLHEALESVRKYPEYRKQSNAIQQKLEGEIQSIRKSQEESVKRLDEMEKDTKRRERNKLRDRLLQNFRYFTSKEKNPLQAWTRMEAEAFWELFKDYEDVDGDGYVHSEVQPAMNLLEVIEMEDTEKVTQLMKSRG